MKKLVSCVLTALFIFCLGSSAVAVGFDGYCKNYFFTDDPVTKEYSSEDYASVYVQTHVFDGTSNNCKCTMRLYLDGSTSVKASNVMYVNTNDGYNAHKTAHLVSAYRGNAGVDTDFHLKVDNTYHRGTKIHIAGNYSLTTSGN